MEIYQEPIYYQNPLLCIKVWEFSVSGPQPPRRPSRWHYHKEIEFILVKKGRHRLQTPSATYDLGPGDVMAIGSSRLHTASRLGEEELVYIVLHVDLEPYFDPAMMPYYRHFAEIAQPLEELNYIFAENKEARDAVGQIIESIHGEMMRKPMGYEIAASMHIKHLLLTLLRGDSRGLLQAHEHIDGATIKPILAYIEEHLSERIELEAVSRMAGMSYHYFSRYFKKTMGVPFTDYVNRKRIAAAERLLVTSGRSVGDIAESVGIDNMAHFYELFRRYNGCTPKQFLRRMMPDASPALRERQG